VKTHSKSQAGASVGAGRRTIVGPTGVQAQGATLVKRKVVVDEPKAAPATKAGKAARRTARSSRVASEVKKLVCRYCGSDDLAPSFRKRRDARCRACFKQRYGSGLREKKATRARQGKAIK
jgi:hypothetical protein